MLNYATSLSILIIALAIICLVYLKMQVFPKKKEFYSIKSFRENNIEVEPAATRYYFDEVRPLTQKEVDYLMERVRRGEE